MQLTTKNGATFDISIGDILITRSRMYLVQFFESGVVQCTIIVQGSVNRTSATKMLDYRLFPEEIIKHIRYEQLIDGNFSKPLEQICEELDIPNVKEIFIKRPDFQNETIEIDEDIVNYYTQAKLLCEYYEKIIENLFPKKSKEDETHPQPQSIVIDGTTTNGFRFSSSSIITEFFDELQKAAPKPATTRKGRKPAETKQTRTGTPPVFVSSVDPTSSEL